MSLYGAGERSIPLWGQGMEHPIGLEPKHPSIGLGPEHPSVGLGDGASYRAEDLSIPLWGWGTECPSVGPGTGASYRAGGQRTLQDSGLEQPMVPGWGGCEPTHWGAVALWCSALSV